MKELGGGRGPQRKKPPGQASNSMAGQRHEPERSATFQERVLDWLMACFSMEICRDRVERNHRFLEEALELVQSLGCTASEAHQLVDYVFGRKVGEPMQEMGGVVVTLHTLASANDMDVAEAGETELARVWTKIDKIREKQAAKPKHSPLPQHVDAQSPGPAQLADVAAYAAKKIDEIDKGLLPIKVSGQFNLAIERFLYIERELRAALGQPLPSVSSDDGVKK
jgi:hypothetical protein